MNQEHAVEAQSYFQSTVEHLKQKKQILFLTTSNRWVGEKDAEMPKSTSLAYRIADEVGRDKVIILEVPKMTIFPCEGNVSTKGGNSCGLKEALLKDPSRNPSGFHRCWASINNPSDELWKISKALFASDAVVFFGSIRWGQMNSYYQKLIERLTWLENRHSNLGESNLLGALDAGIIAVGQNWRGKEVVEVQKQVFAYYGFHVVDALCWNWQFTQDDSDESGASYRQASEEFEKTFQIK